MNNDFYSEQLVAKKSGGSETAKKILIGVLTALVAAFLFLIIIFPLSLLLVGLVFFFLLFKDTLSPVSYTHLTLPTILRV